MKRSQSPHFVGDVTIRTVLVVDDSRLQRRILSASLTRWGFEVLEAETGVEALALCEEHQPDLVLSDWMMPGMDGLEFCRAFRAMDREYYGYFILLTSKSEKSEVARGLDEGADDFLTKPVNANELRARITAGDRILRMEKELTAKNQLVHETLNELQTLYNGLDSDLIEAKKLQQSLVRERYRDFGAAEISLLLRPSGHVGGDLIGFFPIDRDQVGLFAIDVSGHGISSALMTARLAGYLSSSAPDQNVAMQKTPTGWRARRPADVVAHLNRVVLEEMDTEHYFTLMLAVVDLQSGRITLAQAGHPHPLIQRADGSIEQNGPGGLPVGLLPNVDFDQFEITLAPGDRMLILSDGLTECPDPKGVLLGEEGLEAMMRDLSSVRGSAVLETLLWKLNDYSGGEDFPDDVSAVLLEFKPKVKKRLTK